MYTDLLCNQKKKPRMHYDMRCDWECTVFLNLNCIVWCQLIINTLYSFLMWHPQSVSDLAGEEFLHVSTCSDFWLTLFSRPTDFCWKVLESSCFQLLYAAMHFANVDSLPFLWICRVLYCICTRASLGRSIVLLSPYALKHGEGWPEYTMALCIKVTNIQVRNGKSLGPPHRGAYDPFSFELPQDGTEAMLCTSWHVRALSNSTKPRPTREDTLLALPVNFSG